MSLPKEEANALIDCMKILAQLENSTMRQTMAINVNQRIQVNQEWFKCLPTKHIAILFFPNDKINANKLHLSLESALKSGECPHYLDKTGELRSDILSPGELALWPACPPVPADSPLRFWVSPAMRANTQKGAMKKIALPAGTVHVEYEEMVNLMAKALSDGEPVADVLYVAHHEAIEKELGNDVDSGALRVYDPLARGRHSLPIGDALRTALVKVADFQSLAAARAIDVIVEAAYVPTESDRAALRARIEDKNAYLDSLPPKERRAVRETAGMQEVSRAPIPFDSVRSEHRRQPTELRPIDWSHWRLMPEVLLREAVALSVNLNPKNLQFGKEGQEFNDRLDIALSHAKVGNFQLIKYYPKNEPVSPVLLAVFAKWAVSHNIEMPPELAAMAAASLDKPNNDTLAVAATGSASGPTLHQAAQGVSASSGNALASSDSTGGIPPERVFTICAQPLCVDPALRALSPDTTVWAKFYWGVTRDGSSVRELAGDVAASHAIEKIETIMKRQANGYFTVNEAAQVIADARDMKAHKLVESMLRARANGKLKIRDPEAREVDMPADTSVRDNVSLVKIADVCKALEIEDLSDKLPMQAAPVVSADASKPKAQIVADKTKALAVPQATGPQTTNIENVNVVVQPATAPTITHSTKPKRRDDLAPVIEKAQSLCPDPMDTAAVWVQLEALAQAEYLPLLAAMPEGLKYTKKGTAAYFTRDALSKRLARSKAA
jgi:hypothetical protein